MNDPAAAEEDLQRFREELTRELTDMVALLMKKRRSYGPHNLVRFGAIGIVIRASDKIDRLANLMKDGTAESADGDTVEDAWRDLIGYGVLGLLRHKGRLVP